MTSQEFLEICIAISTITAAAAAVFKWVTPAVRLKSRIDKIEKRQKEDFEIIQFNEEANRVLCKAMLCLLENVEDKSGNNSEIESARKDLQEFLLERMVKH